MSVVKTLKKATGDWGEEVASRYLKGRGLKILANNWRKGSYELDIVCTDKDTLIFVEVKTRGEGSLETPEEALTVAKKTSLLKAAREYLKTMDAWDLPCRFDLICVKLVGKSAETSQVEHIENVIEFSDFRPAQKSRRGSPVDSGNSPWQPW